MEDPRVGVVVMGKVFKVPSLSAPLNFRHDQTDTFLFSMLRTFFSMMLSTCFRASVGAETGAEPSSGLED